MKLKYTLRALLPLLLLVSVLMLKIDASAQVKMRNLTNFDERRFHFGMILGINNSSFFLDRNPTDTQFTDSIYSVVPDGQSGFDIHMLASLDMTTNFRLRFQPGLSFQDRAINYDILNSENEVKTEVRRTESVFLEFPLLLKIRTDRVGNFAAYGIVGGKFGIDMQTQKDAVDVAENEIVRLRKNDYSIEAGGGIDLFLTYFKLGFELKTAFGLPNLLIHEEGNSFTTPINSLKTRAVMFSVTFEG